MTIEIAVLVYDGVTALDAVGPMQVLSALPGATVKWVAAEPGPKRSDAGVALVADHALGAVPRPDIVLVPGAMDVRPATGDPRVLGADHSAHDRVRPGAALPGRLPHAGAGGGRRPRAARARALRRAHDLTPRSEKEIP